MSLLRRKGIFKFLGLYLEVRSVSDLLPASHYPSYQVFRHALVPIYLKSCPRFGCFD